MVKQSIRLDTEFDSLGTRCSARWFFPKEDATYPVIVMAHGLGAVKDMRLPYYAERFAAAGYACLLFDYRNLGACGGEKRQLIRAQDQLIDWNSAVDFAKQDPRIDSNRIVVFGTSFSGGHVCVVAANRPDIWAVIAQCPYLNSGATIRAYPAMLLLRNLPYLIADVASQARGYRPVMLPLSGPPGDARPEGSTA